MKLIDYLNIAQIILSVALILAIILQSKQAGLGGLTGGDTGGVFRALRTIPVLLDICDDMDELARKYSKRIAKYKSLTASSVSVIANDAHGSLFHRGPARNDSAVHPAKGVAKDSFERPISVSAI